MNTITIYIVDDHQMLIDGLKAILKGEPEIKLVGESTFPLLAFEEIQMLKPRVVLTDISMPEMTGVELVRKLKPRMPDTFFITLSMYNERGYIKDMLQAGVSAYILKNTGREELIRAIKSVITGKEFFSEEVSELLESTPLPIGDAGEISLTDREIEIVACISKELTNAEIAKQLFISERTVETHRKNIFRKTGTRSVLGLVKMALEKGFIK